MSSLIAFLSSLLRNDVSNKQILGKMVVSVIFREMRSGKYIDVKGHNLSSTDSTGILSVENNLFMGCD